MEPTLPAPHGSPEREPVLHLGSELASIHQGPEKQPIAERLAKQERHTDADAVGTAPVVPMPTVLLPPAPPASQQATVPSDDNNPLTAADEDLIEKEWVDRAKKVIAETKHDPYEQEKAVSRLQADYLNKRYGKTIKLQDGE